MKSRFLGAMMAAAIMSGDSGKMYETPNIPTSNKFDQKKIRKARKQKRKKR